ncbi:hypothetical protein JQC67_00755 [Aurantibacter crassamenti]|uniref:hypothetical protein n=1 Tax=Aurantibacter crassamenti TaxID=1837375 RepID=UPI00193A6D96|nr:hypothetical protein [Aurantibacter crassamenti]MBM1104654.1 hypothetical protein [Aurantibacter crassamenti]
MNNLNAIKAIPKSGTEEITNNGAPTNYNLLDFWRWSVSDILSNATRGRFAEFIVGTATEINSTQIRSEWDAFDLTTNNGIKIEVKSAAYIQSWNQRQLSNISFSIKKAKAWDYENYKYHSEIKRHADVYVFCHLKHKDQNTINPLKMEQWDFYVLPTFKLNNYERSQSSITINSLRKFTEAKEYAILKTEIEKAYKEQKHHITN